VELRLTEYVLDAVIAKLKTGMTARIATINNDSGNVQAVVGTPLDQDFYLGGASSIPSGRYPAIIVTDGGGNEGATFEEEGPHHLNLMLEVVVFILDEDSDRQRLARKLLRLEKAVVEVLWDDEPKERIIITNDDQPYLRPARIQPGPVFNPEQDGEPYRQWRAVVFAVHKYE
jgi:hypothetical protein